MKTARELIEEYRILMGFTSGSTITWEMAADFAEWLANIREEKARDFSEKEPIKIEILNFRDARAFDEVFRDQRSIRDFLTQKELPVYEVKKGINEDEEEQHLEEATGLLDYHEIEYKLIKP